MTKGTSSWRSTGFILVALFIVSISSFIIKTPATIRHSSTKVCMVNQDVVVVGVAGGVAESVACKLLETDGDGSISAVFDRRPFSPILLAAAKTKKLQILSADFDKDQLLDITDERIKSFVEVLNGKVVIAVNDEGDEALRGDQENSKGEAGQILTRLLKSLPPSVKSIVCATSAESDKTNSGTHLLLLEHWLYDNFYHIVLYYKKIISLLYVKIRTRIKFKSNLSPLFSQIFHVLEPTIILELCNSSLLSSTPHHSLILVYSCYSQHCILGPFAFMGGGRGSEPFRNWCITNSKPFSLFRYGTLTG